MKNIDELKSIISSCKTDKQVIKAVEAAGYKVVKDTGPEIGTLSIWISDKIRIYKRRKNEYILQEWTPVKFEYSGIPTFFATNSYF